MNKDNAISRLIKSVNDEYAAFKANMLTKSVETVYDECYSILFYRAVTDYFASGLVISGIAFPEQKCNAIIEHSGDSVLADLYGFYMKREYGSILTYDDITELFVDFIHHIMKEAMK